MNNKRDVQRQPITVKRDCNLGIITFKQLEWKDHVAHIVDLSKKGIGVESISYLEPGFVWFKDRVGGHRGGVLVWSKQLGAKYRAGIKFLALSRDAERSVQEHLSRSKPHTPVRDPEKIIATLMESIDRNES
ncbi:MAG TPA: PilZ domain-containing protein [Nitrospirota bacterium]|nr:PilZ domain-containing protein [Nitrospirota bacterium]